MPTVIPLPPPIAPAPMTHRPEWQTGVWPIALAAFVGVTVGFALGQVFPLRSSGVTDSIASPVPGAVAPSSTPLPPAAPPVITPPIINAPPVVISEPLPPPASAPVASAPPALAPAAQTPAAPPAQTPSAAPPPAPVERRLTLRSTPAGARVSVNGRVEGQTPMTLRGLDPGTYTVRLTRDGFAPLERRVVINNAQPTQTIAVTLVAEKPATPAPPAAARGAAQPARGAAPAARGSLQIESRPAGVRVLIDGKLIGTTPVAVPDLAPGEYVVTMQREGYRTWTDRVTVVAGERIRVAASLETQP